MYFFAFGKIYGYTKYVDVFDAKAIMFIFIIMLFLLQVYQLTKRPIKGSTYSIAITVTGLLIIVFPFSHIILLKTLNDGVFYIIMLNIVIMCNDTFAYFGGTLFGRHKTNFIVSPNKSWEGYFSGLLFSIISVIITNQFYASFYGRKLFTLDEAAVLGIFFSISGNIGDLSESLFKRDGCKKDSGTIIPGHGGMWDTFDALIFSMPIFYYYLILKGVI
jgi:phosphatidate cytidylyltransferase